MNPLDSGSLIFSESLTIPNLIKLMRHSFHMRDFDEIQNILMDCEKKMKYELINLIKDCNLNKEEAALLERIRELTKLEKLELEEELRRSEIKCKELNGTITKMIEESEERYRKVIEENSKLRIENKNLISENERLKQKSLENQPLLGARLAKLEKVIEEMVGEKFPADQSDKELLRKQLESVQYFKEMKADVVPELNKSIMENLVGSSGMKKDTGNNVWDSPDLPLDCGAKRESERLQALQNSAHDNAGLHGDCGPTKMSGAGCSTKMVCPLSSAVDLIEVNDSSDDYESNQIPPSEPKNKQVEHDDSPIASSSKKRRRKYTSSKNNSPTNKKGNHGLGSYETAISKKPIPDPDSDDSSSCSDSYMEILVASLKSKTLGKK